MADKQPVKKKRVVKNPETFRERAIKATEASDKPTRASGVKRRGGKIARPAAKPLRAAGKVILPAYIRNSWQELRKVTWPGWKQSRQLTGAVLIFAAIFGTIVAVVDWGLDRIFRDILFK